MLNEARVRPSYDDRRYLRGLPEELYDKSDSSHIVQIISAMVGDAGVKSIRKSMLLGRLETALDTTEFSDLDTFFGGLLRLPRTVSEQYAFDPMNDLLTEGEWAEVRSADAEYRKRIRRFLSAISYGGTREGIRLAAEAAVGVPCDVFETSFGYLADGIVDRWYPPMGRYDLPMYEEVLVIPTVAPATENERQQWRRQIYLTTSRLKPQDALISTMFRDEVSGSTIVDDAVVIPSDAKASSEMFKVVKHVSARASWAVPYNPKRGHWLEPNVSHEQPKSVYAGTQHDVIDMTGEVLRVSASSSHIGKYNAQHAQMYDYLGHSAAEFESVAANAIRSMSAVDVYSPHFAGRGLGVREIVL